MKSSFKIEGTKLHKYVEFRIKIFCVFVFLYKRIGICWYR